MFRPGFYTTLYYHIIDAAKGRVLVGYNEKHHIIPKSLGGDNAADNLVRLTAREHFICHLLLVRMTEGDARRKMLRAAWYISNYHKFRDGHRPTSRVYQALKEANAKATSEKQKGRPWPKLEAAKLAMKKAWEKRRLKSISDETRQKLSAAGKGQKRVISPEHAAKISAAKKGRPGPKKSADTRAKMALSQQKRFEAPVSEETRRRQSEAQRKRYQAASIA